ncbi:hypothetical protein OSB04_026439 [Centaurea solstitialis]|uniref:Mitochondrial import receptor subunit TOM20 n=1 Tax=Centaurea solstitialis TaxID=347529 RepID=A0AA38SWY6_9ASTR|nr:hypothetical protein OSB04_026439 [Centaurea solstitialis]
MEMQMDFDRVVFFEHARRNAEATYAKNPQDAENLTRWGGALLELSSFQSIEDSKNMIKEAISKLDEALSVDPKRHDALWCMGNAQTSYAFLTPDKDEARGYFNAANTYFQKAIDEACFTSTMTLKSSLFMYAPDLHAELHKQGFNQQVVASGAGAGSSTSSNAKALKSQKNSDLKYDICGWVILAATIVVWIGFAKANVPPPPPS